MPEFILPEDLTGLTDEELGALLEQAVSEFDGIYGADGGPQAADVARATELANAIETLNGQRTQRAEEAAATTAQLEELRSRVHASTGGDEDSDADAADPAVLEATPAADVVVVTPADIEPAPTTNVPALVAGGRAPARTAPRETGGLNPQRGRLNTSLRTAQQSAPSVPLPRATSDMVITAAAATSGAPIGHQFTDLTALGKFLTQHARSLSVTHGNPSYTPFATIQTKYAHVLGEHTDPAQVERILNDLTSPEVLTAAGGWCAPSEIRYDFFNVACQERSNIIDLPVIGIDRGGIRWPVSPSLADVLVNGAQFVPFSPTFSNASMPWLWTEADDILAVTGSPRKPCVRVPCPTFAEARLECWGYCVTSGNLADAAFPEATQNFLSLLMAANTRISNFRYLAQMVNLSTLSSAASGFGCAGAGTAAPLLGALELAAVDYRARYGMCDDDVLEVVLPYWINGAIRSDLSKRTGVNLISVTDAMIADWFDSRGVRVQLVGEYQQRAAGYPGSATPLNNWPSTVEFMIYAAGTFVRGDGMSLDLGVVRDSTLNATNDFTAAWAEECHLIAMRGHASRRYIVNICTDGTTGAADLTGCCP